mmetsp:Transcript_30691/g.57469  ORF Transcript_30691/g.57469 Transcript_30691/m.57469 type:complete len:93 (+) Transcript_30691:1363-1641(+)
MSDCTGLMEGTIGWKPWQSKNGRQHRTTAAASVGVFVVNILVEKAILSEIFAALFTDDLISRWRTLLRKTVNSSPYGNRMQVKSSLARNDRF